MTRSFIAALRVAVAMVLFGSAPVRAQTPPTPVLTGVVASQRDVRAIAVTSLGTWLGTSGGLVLMHGSQVIRRVTTMDGLSAQDVRVMKSEADTLFIGTERGVIQYTDHEIRFTSTAPVIALAAGQGRVVALCADRKVVLIGRDGPRELTLSYRGEPYAAEFVEGDLYVGTSQGLFRWNGSVTARVRGIARGEAVFALRPGATGELFAATAERVLRIARGRVRQEVASIPFVRALGGTNRALLAGTWGLGAYRVTARKERESLSVPPGLHVQAIAESSGSVYVGHRDGLLVDGKSIKLEGWSSNDLSAVAITEDRTLYLGTFDRGLIVRATDGREHVWTEANGLVSNRVNALAVFEGSAWAALDQGVCRIREGRVTCFRPAQGPAIGHAQAFFVDGSRLWVGSSGGLAIFEHGDWRNVTLEGVDLRRVTAVTRWRDDMWIGTAEGLLRVRETERGVELVARLSASAGALPDDWVTSVIPTEDALWVGTYAHGLAKLTDDGHYEHAFNAAWINPGACVAARSSVACGGLDNGLLFARGQERVAITRGLPSQDVTGIAQSQDTLYVATRSGLAVLRLGDSF